MAFLDTIKEKWENFQYWLEEHHIPKPVFFLILFVLFVALAYFLFTYFFAEEQIFYNLEITVLDSKRTPISGATVTVESKFFDKITKTTNVQGKANFDIPAKKEFTVVATYKGESSSMQMILEKDEQKILVLAVEVTTYADKKVIFYIDDTTEKATDVKEVVVSCSKTDWVRSLYASSGEVLLEKLPSNCGTLTVKVENEIYTTTDLSSKPFEIKVRRTAMKGSVLAIIKNAETGLPLGAGEASASLINEFGITIDGPVQTSAAGSVSFKDVDPGKYAISVSGLGKYKNVISEYKEVKGSGQVIFEINLQPAVRVYQIKVRVVDTKNMPVKAVLELRDLASNVIVQNKYTDDKGEYIFNVDEDKNYNLIVKVGDWTENFLVRPSDAFYDITYDVSKLKDKATVIVFVKDTEDKPLEKARVEIFTKDHASTGLICCTGADGRCEFDNVMPGIYYAKASFMNYPPVASGNFEVKPPVQGPIEVVLKIDIQKAGFVFFVYGENREIINNANIAAYDSKSGVILGESKTDINGTAKISLPAGLKPYFVISAPETDYLPYVTLPIDAVFGTTITKEVVLIKGKSVKIIFDGLSLKDGDAERTLSAGTTYIARFRLIVPSERYSGAGIFILSGNDISGKTNLMEEDTTYLGLINSSATRIARGTTYTPPNGTAIDLESAANENAKWVELEWVFSRMPVAKGVFEAEVEYTVKDGVSQGEIAKLGYRGYAYAETVERDPKDTVLGNLKNSPEKHSLYATLYSVVYAIGETNLCDGKFCRSFSIEDLGKRTKTFVIDSYSAELNSEYRLNFVINRQAGSSADATLRIFDEQRAFRYGEYNIIKPDGSEITDVAERDLAVNIGRFSQNSTVSGSIRFLALKEGDIPLRVSIEDASGKVFEHYIAINVAPGRELSVDIVPKVIIGLVDNEVLFKFTDKNTGEAESG
ncbi:MAG: carboxypeptidase-like regulatory domain-containing protein, partial [Candidatus Diapherotrites archaeon]